MKSTILLLIALAVAAAGCNPRPEASRRGATGEPAKSLYWGDLHNHNEIGQIKGSLERSYEIARSHLDFFCFTPQSQWVDMPDIPKGKTAQFIRGFDASKANWDKMKRLAEENTRDGEFVAFLGYEIHSNKFGDYHIVFPGADGELVYLDDIGQWQDFAAEHGAVLIQHHPGYKPGWRGAHWEKLDPRVSPVVEMLSEHGNAESDRAPIRYIRHSMGGRYTGNTVHRLWESGVQTGIVASTDDHLGFPGAYGEGLAGVWAGGLTRDAVMEAIKARRTYAVNADRIGLEFRLNGRWMGETLPAAAAREIAVKVTGEDAIDRVEVLRNNRVIHRDHPVDRVPGPESWDQPVLCRVEYGWGPWAAFDMARVCDWEFTVEVTGGEILAATPHLQSRPFDEERRHRVQTTAESCQVLSYTSRQDAFEDRPNNDVVLKIQGSPETKLALRIKRPVEMVIEKTLGELAEANEIGFTGAFSSESVMLHRVVFAEHYTTEFTVTDRPSGPRTDWYTVRVAQTNGSYAWSSPVWVEAGE